MSASVVLRTLTRKSKIGFGRLSYFTVQEMIDHKKHNKLIYAYYRLSKINFIEDILTELEITEEFRISKPGTDSSMMHKYNKHTNNKYIPSKKRNTRGEGADKLIRLGGIASKGTLARKNQGH